MMKRLRRTTMYLIFICAFLLCVNVSLGYVLTKQSDAAIRTLIENRMLDVSNTAAAMLDGDELRIIQADDKDTPEYQSVLKTLSYFQDNIDLSYIYCVRDMGNKNFVFTIDPSDDPGEFGEAVAYTEALYQASLGTPSVDKEPYGDRWGRFYSAYTPVYDSDHQITGIVAVDFSADWYERQISTQIKTTILVSGVSLFIACLLIIFVAARFRKQFRFMINEMNVVSDGIETLVKEISPETELGMQQEAKADTDDGGIGELSNKIHSLEDQLGEKIAFVRSQAYVDGLTGLGNRTSYEEQVNQIEDAIKAGNAEFGVAIFDLNGLKGINDTFGHEQGDRAIVKVAGVLKRTFGEAKLYRIGGDEFIVLTEGKEKDFSSKLDVIEKELGGRELVTVAKGCAKYHPNEDAGYRDVFKRADNAMYEDKKAFYQTHEDRRKGTKDKTE